MTVGSFVIEGISNIGSLRLDVVSLNALIAPSGYGKSNVLRAIGFGMDFLSANEQEKTNKQNEEFNESLKMMQETNGELNKSITKLTAQNTQAAKDLQEAKDQARDLERKLSENSNNIWMWVAIISFAACIAVLIFK